MGIFHPGKVISPSGLILGGKAPEAGFELLVEALCLPIGLQMITESHADRGTEEPTELTFSANTEGQISNDEPTTIKPN